MLGAVRVAVKLILKNSCRSDAISCNLADVGQSSMSSRDELVRAVDDFEKANQRSIALGDDTVDQRRRAVQFRRETWEIVAEIAAHGPNAFAGQEWKAKFRDAFWTMRSTMALHQASWPVVSADKDAATYQASVKKVREENQRFIAWARQAVSKASRSSE